MSWAGECNSCGICCVSRKTLPEYGREIEFRCLNLLVGDEIGRPGATVCGVWKDRTENMPIIMRSLEGFEYKSRCLPNYPRPHDAVPPECSYEFVPDSLVQIKPRWEMGYLPEL